MKKQLSVAQLLSHARTLDPVSDTPQLDCQLLLAHLLQARREWLLAHGEHQVAPQAQVAFKQLIRRRQVGESVAGIIGKKDFWKRSFTVSEATLIPRPETELLLEILLARFSHAPQRVVDLGTGAGGIVISLADERPRWQLFGTDKSLAALRVAQHNSRQDARQDVPRHLLGGDQKPAPIAWLASSWCASLAPESLDIIVSNPPYVRSDDTQTLKRLAFEPETALVAGTSGLDAIRTIVVQGFACLKPGGHLLIEHAMEQQAAVSQLLQAAGFSEIETFRDLHKLDRAVLARK